MAASGNQAYRQILITGPPGIGKTTLIKRVCDALYPDLNPKGLQLTGFYSQELREGGSRCGFEVVELPENKQDHKRAPLAKTGVGLQGPQVGKYTVTVKEFESLALDTMKYA